MHQWYCITTWCNLKLSHWLGCHHTPASLPNTGVHYVCNYTVDPLSLHMISISLWDPCNWAKINIYTIEYWKISHCHDLQYMLFFHPTLTTSKKIHSYEEFFLPMGIWPRTYEMAALVTPDLLTLSMSNLKKSKKASRGF